MIDLASLLKLLPTIKTAADAIPEFKKVYDEIVSGFKPQDQATLKAAYADLMIENDEGHAELQAKLSEAGKR